MRLLRCCGLAAVLVALGSLRADAQCVIEGVTHLASLRPADAAPLPITQTMRLTLSGPRATIEGLRPLSFRTGFAAESVDLFVGGSGFVSGVLSAAAGVRVRVLSTAGSDVIAELHDSDGLVARELRLPCQLLRTTPGPVGTSASPPKFAANPGWVSHSVAQREMRCTRDRGGGMGCAPTVLPGRCQPVGDASACGYHPLRAWLRLHERPAIASPSVLVKASRDVAFIDEDGRPGWIRVVSRGIWWNRLVVGGWVRLRDVRWSQEVPPSLLSIGLGTMGIIGGRSRGRGTRVGSVTLAPDTPIVDAAGRELARVAETPFCTAAELPANASQVLIALPGSGMATEPARVAADQVHWVTSCTP